MCNAPIKSKICAVLAVGIMLLVWSLPCVAALSTTHIIDHLGVMSQGELDVLQSGSDHLGETYHLDVVILLTDDTDGKISRDFADDFYDQHNYGLGSDEDGLLMLVNMDQREIWITTAGKAIDLFTDQRIDAVTASVASFLADGDFYEAGKEFLFQVEHYATLGVPADQYREPTETSPSSYMEKVVRMITFWPLYIVALVIAGVATLAVSSTHSSKSTVTSHTYDTEGSFQITNSRDEFLRETTTHTKIQKASTGSSSGGSRSSTHRSSSGRTRGGGGRKF